MQRRLDAAMQSDGSFRDLDLSGTDISDLAPLREHSTIVSRKMTKKVVAAALFFCHTADSHR